LGQTQEADQSFSRAQVLAESQEAFLLARAQKYLLLGWADRAMADADAVLAENAKSAYAYFFKAQAYESQDALAEADSAYTKASELAAAAGETNGGLHRVQQAYLFSGCLRQSLMLSAED
jgi:tetratricopeptide (TPR) repeat protein